MSDLIIATVIVYDEQIQPVGLALAGVVTNVDEQMDGCMNTQTEDPYITPSLRQAQQKQEGHDGPGSLT